VLNEIFELIHKRSKWVFFYLSFFSTLGLFSFISLVFNIKIESGLMLSMSAFGSISSLLFTANKINNSKYQE